MGFLNRQTGDFCRWVYGGSWSALVFIYILGYTMSFCSYLLLFYLTFILSNLLLFNLRLQNVDILSTKFSTLKCRSENRSRKAGCYTCLIPVYAVALSVLLIRSALAVIRSISALSPYAVLLANNSGSVMLSSAWSVSA
jgi:hypothetical protein